MDDGLFNVRKDNFSSTHFLLLDDFGTKIAFERLNDFKPSWLLETSPGNFQAGIIFKEPLTNSAIVSQLQKAIITAGLCDPGANGPTNRWSRLPEGINGKVKYTDQANRPFQCKLASFDPQIRYTVEEIVNGLKLTLLVNQPSKKKCRAKNLLPMKYLNPRQR